MCGSLPLMHRTEFPSNPLSCCMSTAPSCTMLARPLPLPSLTPPPLDHNPLITHTCDTTLGKQKMTSVHRSYSWSDTPLSTSFVSDEDAFALEDALSLRHLGFTHPLSHFVGSPWVLFCQPFDGDQVCATFYCLLELCFCAQHLAHLLPNILHELIRSS